MKKYLILTFLICFPLLCYQYKIKDLSQEFEYFDEKEVTHISRWEDEKIIRYAMHLYDDQIAYENYICQYEKSNSTWDCHQFLKIKSGDNLTINKIDDQEVIEYIVWLFEQY